MLYRYQILWFRLTDGSLIESENVLLYWQACIRQFVASARSGVIGTGAERFIRLLPAPRRENNSDGWS